MVWRSREEALKEAEKFNEKSLQKSKLSALTSKVLPGNALIQSLLKKKSLQCESNIEGTTRQHINPVLSEEKESAMQDH